MGRCDGACTDPLFGINSETAKVLPSRGTARSRYGRWRVARFSCTPAQRLSRERDRAAAAEAGFGRRAEGSKLRRLQANKRRLRKRLDRLRTVRCELSITGRYSLSRGDGCASPTRDANPLPVERGSARRRGWLRLVVNSGVAA
jgi:hypothetical protein